MSRVEVSTNELLEELRRAITPDAPPEAMTVEEMMKALGVGKRAVQNQLAVLREEGRLVEWARRRVDASGRNMRVPAYTIAKKPKK